MKRQQEEATPARPGRGDWVLPALSQRTWPILRAILFCLLAITAVADVVGHKVNTDRSMARPFGHLGLGYSDTNGKLRLTDSWTQEGIRAGIRRGQAIVAIDGHPVGESIADLGDVGARLTRPEGAPVVLTTRDPDGTIGERRLTRSVAHVDAQLTGSGLNNAQVGWISLALQLVPDLFMLLVAAMLLRARRHDTVGVVIASFFALGVMSSTGPSALFVHPAMLVVRDIVGFLAVTALTVALLAFPDGRIRGRLRKVVMFLIPGVSGSLALGVTLPDGFVSIFFPVMLGILVLLIMGRARALGGTPDGLQVRTALFGFAIGLLMFIASAGLGQASSATALSDPALSTWLFLLNRAVDGVGIMALAGGILISLLRYRLYEVEALISRSAAVGVMTLGFVAAFAALESLLQNSAVALFSDGGGKVAGAVSAALAAALIVPLHRRINDWTERRFRKGMATLRHELARDVDDLRESASAGELAAFVEQAIATGVNARWVALRTGAANPPVDAGEAEFHVPLTLGDGRSVGTIEVGPRLDGTRHGRDEREAVEGVSEAIARAVWVVERRRQKEAELDARLTALERAIGASKEKGAKGKLRLGKAGSAT